MLFNEEEQVVAQQSTSYTNYLGIAAREIICVNPTKKELKELFDREVEDEPVYKKEVTIGDKTFTRVSINVRGRIAPISADFTTTFNDAPLNNTFSLDKNFNVSETKGTFQVVDDFGRSCWITKEQYQNKEVPVYSSGHKADIDVESWHPAYVGEVDIINFFKILFNIPELQVYNNGQWVENPQLNGDINKAKFWTKADTENLLKGNFKDLKEAVRACNKKNRTVINYFYTEVGSNGSDFQKMMNDTTLPPRYSLKGATNAFKKKVDQTIAYYQNANPDKLNKIDLSYVGLVKVKEVKPTEFNYTTPQEAPVVDDLPVGDNDLPF